MTFGEKVKQVRFKLYMSQESMAKELGVSFATVNRWERGKHEPGLAAQKDFHLFCQRNDIEFIDDSNPNA